MKTPSILQQDSNTNNREDEDAEAQAAEARLAGTTLVRNHLRNHLEHNNCGRSADYVTWIATLHPENAEISIDPRFFVPNNPWWTIYEDTKKESSIPSAEAIPISEEGEAHATASATAVSVEPYTEPAQVNNRKNSCYHCNPFEKFVGYIVTLHALLSVFICEILGISCYFVACLFYYMAKPFASTNVFTGLFYSTFMIVYYALAFADSTVLVASVITTESLAFVAWIFTLLFAGISASSEWHQYIRKICHHSRQILRSKKTHPPRHVLICYNNYEPKKKHAADTNEKEETIPVSSCNNTSVTTKRVEPSAPVEEFP